MNLRLGFLPLTLCLFASIDVLGQSQDGRIASPLPSDGRWKGGLPFENEPSPPLRAEWSVDLSTLAQSSDVLGIVAGVAVTNRVAVVSYTSFCASPPTAADCIKFHLASFDRNTGKLRKSIELRAKTIYSNPPLLLSATANTFLAQQDEELTEYDEELKTTNHIRLPRGMTLGIQQPYGYAYWAEATGSMCKQNIQVYDLNAEYHLILGCGQEVGIVDDKWQPVFFERYTGRDEFIGFPDFSEDGYRAILTLQTGSAEIGMHMLSYVLYDLRGDKVRKITFLPDDKAVLHYHPKTGISADGAMFVIAGIDQSTHSPTGPKINKLWIFRLPQ